jgi:hypothetical protein
MPRSDRLPDAIPCNGIDAATGRYLENPYTVGDIAALALSQPPDPAREAATRRKSDPGADRIAAFGVDVQRLDQAGWAVVFGRDSAPQVRRALAPLLDRRRDQAGPLYREYAGAEGCLPGESWDGFRRRRRIGAGAARPVEMPYYVLLVGGPGEVPFSFQYDMDVQRGVGRIAFADAAAYERYAAGVLHAEDAAPPGASGGRAALFATQNPDDGATAASRAMLAEPVAEKLAATLGAAWQVDLLAGDAAAKAELAALLGGDKTPDLLLSATHGAAFGRFDPRQAPAQGALVTGEWPGPLQWRQALDPTQHYFAAADLAAGARLDGLIAVLFACFGAGTPEKNDFIHRRESGHFEPAGLADASFLAALPQALLSHAAGPALAVIGHIDRAWDLTFREPLGGEPPEGEPDDGGSPLDPDPGGFASLMLAIASGQRIGSATEYVNLRYAELAARLTNLTYAVKHQGQPLTPGLTAQIAWLWTAVNDARNTIVLGDPAARLAPGLR